MYRKTAIMTVLALTMMLFAGALTPPTSIAADDAKKADNAKAQKEQAKKDVLHKQVTLEGEIVNLQLFLTRGPTPAYSEGKDKPLAERVFGTLAKEVPIGLWVHEKGTFSKLLPGRPVYLIIFDPDVEAQSTAYGQAREWLGMNVRVTGTTYDREGMFGVQITKIENLDAEKK
ncbi:MAG: hypothetical protein GC159_16375 [Phycisphaera sp.]|nr:hypothetical protein [Phycisphaera sp.]